MSYTNINSGKKLVDLAHPSAIPTHVVEADLQAKFPDLLFPYMKQDHVAGVNSNVHAWCDKHQSFTRLSVAGARHRGTKYGCSLCANEHKGGLMPEGVSKRYSTAGYIGRVGVQSGVFRAVKAVFPDAIWEYRMANGKEIDIYVPSIKAGIEYNGNYYHSDAVQKDNEYHARKSIAAVRESDFIFHVLVEEAVAPYDNLVRLLQLFRDAEYLQVKDIAAHSARCKTRQIATAEAAKFHETWNFRKTELSYVTCTHHVGVFEKNILVGVVSGRHKNGVMLMLQASTSTPLIHYQSAIGRLLIVTGARTAMVSASLANPLEMQLLMEHLLGSTAGDLRNRIRHEYFPPHRHLLNDKFELDLSLTPETATASFYDSGNVLLSFDVA